MSIGQSSQNPERVPIIPGQGEASPKHHQYLPTPDLSRESSQLDPNQAGNLVIDPAILALESTNDQATSTSQASSVESQQSLSTPDALLSSVEAPVKTVQGSRRDKSSSSSRKTPVNVQHIATPEQAKWLLDNGFVRHNGNWLQPPRASPSKPAHAAVSVPENDSSSLPTYSPDPSSAVLGQLDGSDELPDVEPGTGSFLPDLEKSSTRKKADRVVNGDQLPKVSASPDNNTFKLDPALFKSPVPVTNEENVAAPAQSAAAPVSNASGPGTEALTGSFKPQNPVIEKLRRQAARASNKHSPTGNFARLNSQPERGSLAVRPAVTRPKTPEPGPLNVHSEHAHEASKSPKSSGGNTSPRSLKRKRVPSQKALENIQTVQDLTNAELPAQRPVRSAVAVNSEKSLTAKSPRVRRDPSSTPPSSVGSGPLMIPKQRKQAQNASTLLVEPPATKTSIKLIIKDKGRGKTDPLPQVDAHSDIPSIPPIIEDQAATAATLVPRPRSNSMSSRSSRQPPAQPIAVKELPEKVLRWHRLGYETFQDVDETGNIDQRAVVRRGKPDETVEYWLNKMLVRAANEYPDTEVPQYVASMMRVRTDNTVPKMLTRKVQEWGLQVVRGPQLRARLRLVPIDRLEVGRDKVLLAVLRDEEESKAVYGKNAVKVLGNPHQLAQKTGWDWLMDDVVAKAKVMKNKRSPRRRDVLDNATIKKEVAIIAGLEWEDRLSDRGPFVEDWEGGFVASTMIMTPSDSQSSSSADFQLGYRRRKGGEEAQWMSKAEIEKVLNPYEDYRSRPAQVVFTPGQKTKMTLEYARFKLPEQDLAAESEDESMLL
jgi:hypothetical protein